MNDIIIEGNEEAIKESNDAALDQMKNEAKDLGLKSPFREETTTTKVEEKQTEVISPKEESKEKTEVSEDKNVSQKSRAPFRELKEQIREGAEKRAEAKFAPMIDELKAQIEQLKKGDLSKVETADLKESIKNLSSELNIKEDHLEKIIKVSRQGLEEELSTLKSKLQEKESKVNEDSEEKIVEEQLEIFNTEWTEVESSLKEKYPNATKDQLAQAKEKMQELAYTDKYVDSEMDYILFKEQQEFEKTLFSPKQKGFESASTHEGDIDDGTEENDMFSTTTRPMSYKDVEKMDRKTQQFEESLPDSRFSIK